MANTNPFEARLAKRRQRAGDLQAARSKLWRAILRAEKVLVASDNTPEVTLKAVHAIAQSIGQYVKVHETGELEARLEALERRHMA